MRTERVPPTEASRGVRRTLWSVLVFLSLIGVGAALYRAAFVEDAAIRAESWRAWFLDATRLTDPLQSDRLAQVAAFDRRFGAHAFATLLHVVPGGLFLLLLPLQFVAAIRTRWPQVHRWLGRVLVVAAVAATLPAFYFGLRHPYAGPAEAITIAAVGIWFLTALARAVVAIRLGEVARHRAWMIRATAVAVGISTVRLVSIPLELALLPLALGPARVFVLAIWIGWMLTLGCAEWWVRRTRPHAAARVVSPLARVA